jgi:hypothetical protein
MYDMGCCSLGAVVLYSGAGHPLLLPCGSLHSPLSFSSAQSAALLSCLVCDVLCVVPGVWCVVLGVWRVVPGVWCVVCGVLCVMCCVWCVVPGVWGVVCGVLCVACCALPSLEVHHHRMLHICSVYA